MRIALLSLLLVPLAGFSQEITQKKDTYGVMHMGKWVVKAKYQKVIGIDERHSKVKCYGLKEEGKWGVYYLNNGEEFGTRLKDLEFKYDSLYYLTDGVAIAAVGQKRAILQINNWKSDPGKPYREIIGPECEQVALWKDKMPEYEAAAGEPIWFTLNSKEGLIVNVESTSLPKFKMILLGADSIVKFESKMNPLKVVMGGKIGLLDLHDKRDYIFPPKYDELRKLEFDKNVVSGESKSNFYLVTEHRRLGFSYIDDKEEVIIVEAEYEGVEQIKKSHLFKVTKGGKHGIIGLDVDGKKTETLLNPGYDEVTLAASEEIKGKRELFFKLGFNGMYGFGALITGKPDKFDIVAIPKYQDIDDINVQPGEEGFVTFDFKLNGKWGYVMYYNNGGKKEVEARYDAIYFADHMGYQMHFTVKDGKMKYNPHDEFSRIFLRDKSRFFSEGFQDNAKNIPGLNDRFKVIYLYEGKKGTMEALKDYVILKGADTLKVKEEIPYNFWMRAAMAKDKSYLLLGEAKIPLKELVVVYNDIHRFSTNHVLGTLGTGTSKFKEYIADEKKMFDVEYTYSAEGNLASVNTPHLESKIEPGDEGIAQNYFEPGSHSKKHKSRSWKYDENGEVSRIQVREDELRGRMSKYEYTLEGRLTAFYEFLFDPQKKKYMGNGIYRFNYDSLGRINSYFLVDNQAKPENADEARMKSRKIEFVADSTGRVDSIKVFISPDWKPDPEGAVYIPTVENEVLKSVEGYDAEGGMIPGLDTLETFENIPALKIFYQKERTY